MKLINGKEIALEIESEIHDKVKKLNKTPKLILVLATNDESARQYVNIKKKKSQSLGIDCEVLTFPKEITTAELLIEIEKLNQDKEVNGILIQLPLFDHLRENTDRVINAVAESKDCDGLTSIQQTKSSQLTAGSVLTAAVEACMISIFEAYNKTFNWEEICRNGVDESTNFLKRKTITIVNDSILIGKPLAQVLKNFETIIFIANKSTENTKELLKQSDIVISATGVGELFGAEDLKQDCVLIDVTSIKKGEFVRGDFIVDEKLEKIAKAITPVPGGIGPLTVACLIRNLVRLVIQ